MCGCLPSTSPFYSLVENMTRAVEVQGDIATVEVFDEKDWKAPGNEVVDQEGAES